MFRTALLALFAFVASIDAAPIPKGAGGQNADLAAMQGEWKLTDLAYDGKSLGADFAAKMGMTWEIHGDEGVMIGQQHKHRITAKLKFDLNAKPRRLILQDRKETDLDGKPSNNPLCKKTFTAIYKIEDDTLIIASYSDDMEGVPEDFTGGPVFAMTFMRVKK